MFLAPDGRVFNAGPNGDSKFLNPNAYSLNGTAANTWSTAYTAAFRRWRGYGSAVMYSPGKILVIGGAGWPAVTNTTEIIDLNTPAAPTFQQATAMRFARTHANATILADGKVLVTGGCDQDRTDDSDAILIPELWTPPAAGTTGGGTWTLMNEMAVPRLYHSTAVLLPDATLLTTGGGQGGGFRDHPDYQIFTPPYLCTGQARPVISSAPSAVAYGQSFTIASTAAASNVRTTLVRLSSVTHSFNMNQRFLELVPTYTQAGQLTMTAPTNPNICPPGHYMLFLLNAAGIPSEAKIIAIGNDACAATVALTSATVVSSPSNCERVTRFTVSNPTNLSVQPNYRWSVNGTYIPGNDGLNTLDWATNTTAPTVQVQIEATRNCAGSPVSGTLSFTSYFPNCNPGCAGCKTQPVSANQSLTGK
jgi:hypothetical protein